MHSTGRHFFANQWTWANGNVSEIWAAAQATEDADDFEFDVRSMDWDLYLKRFVLGTQKYMLKCGEELLPRARKQLQMYIEMMYIVYRRLVNSGVLGVTERTWPGSSTMHVSSDWCCLRFIRCLFNML